MISIIYIKYDPAEVKFKYFYDAWKICLYQISWNFYVCFQIKYWNL